MLNTTSTSIFEAFKIIVLMLFTGFSALGQTNSDYLKQTMDSLFFQEDGNKRPGYSVAIVKENTPIYKRSIGQINVEKEIPLTENSVFAIASCTKQFTAFGVLLLEQEGKLNLTDDIRKHIPELPEFEHTVTIKHLLSHTSGVREHLTLLRWKNWQWTRDYSFNGTIRALQKYPGLSFQPGENFTYSNTGYVLLAILIERASGKTIKEFMQERIFDPLQMNDTKFSSKRDYRNIGFSRPYNYDWEKEKFLTRRHKEVNAMGAVGIYTTINDFIKWDQNFTSMIVGNEALFQKFLKSDTLNNGMTINYNNGLKERYVHGHHVIEHSGGWAFYNFQYTRIPKLGLSIIIGANNELDYPIGMVEKYLKTILPNKRIINYPRAELGMTKLQSRSYLSDNFTFRTIDTDGSSTKVGGSHMYGAKSYELFELPNGKYIDWIGNEFIHNPDDKSFRWSGGSYFNAPRKFHLLDTNSLDLKKLEGNYLNSELGVIRIKFNEKKGILKIKSSFGKNPKIEKMRGKYIDLKSVEYDLLFMNENTFVIGDGSVFNLEFTRK